jgi:nitrogen fixation-related uncharacterized protein
MDDAPSSTRSKKALSIASSRKTVKLRKSKQFDDLRSRQGGESNRDRSERKENMNNVNQSLNAISQTSNLPPPINIIPLEIEAIREIPDDERILRDRKER